MQQVLEWAAQAFPGSIDAMAQHAAPTSTWT